MSTGRALAAVALALATWLAVAFVGFLLAVASISRNTGGSRSIFPVASVVAAVGAALVTVFVLQRGEAHRRPDRGVMLGSALTWPVVFAVIGLVDGRAAGGPEGLAPS